MSEAGWTIEELSERVADALAVGYPGQPSGRVREVPDQRTIRWYTTTGLVDRPVGMRGRTALYGRRHLLQLVAIKRLQTQGLALAEIQRRLLGTDDVELAGLADVSATTVDADRPRFWSARPGVFTPLPEAPAEPAQGGPAPAEAAPSLAATASPLVHGVRLRAGVTLLLDGRPPHADDVAALSAAAEPLLLTIDRLGLGASPATLPAPKGTP